MIFTGRPYLGRETELPCAYRVAASTVLNANTGPSIPSAWVSNQSPSRSGLSGHVRRSITQPFTSDTFSSLGFDITGTLPATPDTNPRRQHWAKIEH